MVNQEREAACRERDAACQARDAANQERETACRERDAASQWESRFREAEGQVEHWQAQAHGRQSQLEELQQQLAAEQSRHAQADSAALQQIDEQRPSWTSSAAALTSGEEQLNAAHRGLTDFESELKRGREALDAERAAQQLVQGEQAASLQRQAHELSQQTTELAARQAELSQAREQLSLAIAACEDRQAQLAADEAGIAACREELATERTEIQVERNELLRLAAAPHSQPGDNAIEGQEVDSVLSRLVQSGHWRTDAEPAADIESPDSEPPAAESLEDAAEMPVADEPQPVANCPTIVGDATALPEEESIETYMERLMQRVRGDSASTGRPPTLAVLHEVLAKEAQQESAPAETQAPAEQQVVTAEEYLPRSQAPEQSSDLAAMRELANTAARGAIQKHYQKSDNKVVAGKLFAAGILLLGSALLGYWAWQIGSITAAAGAGIGLLTGSLWALRGFSRLLNSLKLSRPQDPPAEAAAEQKVPLEAAAEVTAEESVISAEVQTPQEPTPAS